MADGGGWCLRAACSQWGLLIAVIVYVLFGTFMFHHLESGPEQQRKASVQASREDCLRELWIITERLNVLYERNWTRLVHAQLQRFERAVVAGARADRDPQWGLPGSLLYALTLVTTVGWGSSAPRTAMGKAAGMLYALLGAPLLLLWLAAAGGLLARAARKAAVRCRPSHQHGMDNHFQLHEQHSALITPHQYSRNQTPGSTPRPSTPRLPNHHPHNQQTGMGTTAHPQHIIHVAGTAKYTHVFQRAPYSPRIGGTLTKGRQTPHNASIEYLDESQQTATTSAVGTPKRCQVGFATARTMNCSQKSRGVPSDGDPNSLEDVVDTDESEGECTCSHDTPSKMPLIWKSQQNQLESSKEEALKSYSGTSTSTPHDHQHIGAVHSDPPFPITLVLLFLTIYLGLGATLFAVWEGWSFLDSIYFCFITISTIGFGDFAPGQTVSKLSSTDSNKHEYIHLFACCAYLIFGLVLVAMSFSLVQEEVTAKCSQLANSLGLVKH